MENVLKTFGVVVVFVGALVFVAVIMAWPVQLLWNWLMPTIFGLKEITFWQGLGLNILTGVLFRGDSTSGKN
jgi:hypothetical protein